MQNALKVVLEQAFESESQREVAMRRCRQYLTILLLSMASAGCGTMHNLFAPPEPGPGRGIAYGQNIGACVPFGGVARSGLLGTCTLLGPGQVIWAGIKLAGGDPIDEGLTQIGGGLWLTGCGLGALVDVPLSLAGDIVTLPIAYARHKSHPWATWWGMESDGHCLLGRLWPGTPDDEEKTEEQLENSR